MRFRLFGAMVAVAAMVYAAPMLAQQCLHSTNEDASQKARRFAALTAIRNINNAEVRKFAATKAFVPLAQLGVDTSAAADFDFQFSTDGQAYSLIVRDKKDPCSYMLATNQDGVIYQGYPIDFDFQPPER